MQPVPAQESPTLTAADRAEVRICAGGRGASDEKRSAAWLKRLNGLPTTHLLVLTGILCIGLATGAWFNHAVAPGIQGRERLISFLSETLAAILIAFGFAIYGCSLNRRLSRQLQAQEDLGPYQLQRLLGSGGMGDVYLAEHRLLRRLCAVKLIRRDKATNIRMLERFEREVKATAGLTHWNTVQIYDYGCTPCGTFYYAMEYLPGLNLRQVVHQFGPMPPARVVFILKQLCGALQEAGARGLVHRDIKPSNIFLAERGGMYDVAKLLDFGLVRPAWCGDAAMRSVRQHLKGSPRFMCPEQALGQEPDARGDLYSLACVAYYLVSGRAPFEDDNPIMLVVAHGTVPVPELATACPQVPADLSAVIMKCLQKNPEHRYASPKELLRALEACKCGSDWTWDDAEQWWLERTTIVESTGPEPTQLTFETRSADTRSADNLQQLLDPEPTLLGEPDRDFHPIF